jgi:hypothetical protein
LERIQVNTKKQKETIDAEIAAPKAPYALIRK